MIDLDRALGNAAAYAAEEARHIAAGNAWAALAARRWAEWWAAKAEEVRRGS